ncbi:hypothetical protein ES677_00070 [Bizionia gelidisalsuginis]|uniref:Uncharacterized protein n=1 Tax=Bizionia gelidisalsuginis TaxID=291188 RepID=A0ABY3MDX2_9FLAO|nr:hypothetical protein [Bizionia gelidisalsuginis]TYC17810.1 hypothetical protein ES677_00070 [Bizionia gelidisalsuginis]
MGKEILMAMNKNLDVIKTQKESLVLRGVEKLKIIGFTNVTIPTILTDEIYLLYFLSFLNKISNSKNEDEIIAIKELKTLITKRLEI